MFLAKYSSVPALMINSGRDGFYSGKIRGGPGIENHIFKICKIYSSDDPKWSQKVPKIYLIMFAPNMISIQINPIYTTRSTGSTRSTP